MPSNFPGSLDVLSNPPGNQQLSGALLHSSQHGNINDIIEAIEAKLGVGASNQAPVAGGGVLRQTAAGQSAWGQIQAVDIPARIITGGSVGAGMHIGYQQVQGGAAGSNANIAPNSIVTGDIADGTILGQDIAANNINGGHLQDGIITTAKLAGRSVSLATSSGATPSGGLPAGSWVFNAISTSISGLIIGVSYVLVYHTFTIQAATANALLGIGIGIDSSTTPTDYMHYGNYVANGLTTMSLLHIHTATLTGHTYYGLSYCNTGASSMVGYPGRFEIIAFHR